MTEFNKREEVTILIDEDMKEMLEKWRMHKLKKYQGRIERAVNVDVIYALNRRYKIIKDAGLEYLAQQYLSDEVIERRYSDVD